MWGSSVRPNHQVDRKFLLLQCGNVIAAVDQHAAHERVRLERLRGQARIPNHGNIFMLKTLESF